MHLKAKSEKGKCFCVAGSNKTKQNVAQYQESTQKQIGATTQHSVDIEAEKSSLKREHRSPTNSEHKQTVAQYQVSTQKHTGATTPHSVDIEAGNSKLFQHHFTRQLRIEPGRKH